MIELVNCDCKERMKCTPDKFFDLAIVDPPYGGGDRMNFRFNDSGRKVYDNVRPDQEYFDQLFRISKHQIVWGGNYFTDMLPVSKCWISWYKGQPIDSFSHFELAWTNFEHTSRAVKIESYGFNHADTKATGQATIHPTQKPAKLYRWLLMNFAKPGWKIFDSHMGSGSIALACHDLGFDLVATEIDKEYYDSAVRRLGHHTLQGGLF